MKTKNAIKTLVAAVALATAGGAMAAPVVSLVGDKDGLGIGLVSGDEFSFFDLGFDGDGTDEWIQGGITVNHNTGWSGSLTSASLQVFSGGWGLGGAAAVYVNGVQIGNLSDGDAGGRDFNYAYLDTFDLTPFLSLLDGTDQIEFRVKDGEDFGSLDYSQLTLQVTDAGGDPGTVPEPASLALVALGLTGVAALRRRRA